MASKITDDTDEPISDINIVPFVDIILVVLIIFMVTTPFIMKPSINVNLPEAASGEETAPSTLNIAISSTGETTLNGEPVTDQELGNAASQMLKENPQTQAVISADKDVPHGRVVAIIDAVKSNGIRKFAISIDKK